MKRVFSMAVDDKKIQIINYLNHEIPYYKAHKFVEWEDIEIIDKKKIQNNYKEFTRENLNMSNIFVTHTSGSSGNSLRLIKDVSIERRKNIKLWRYRNVINKEIFSSNLLYFYRNFENVSRDNVFIYDSESEELDLSKQNLKRQLTLLKDFQFESIMGPPTALNEFSIYCFEENIYFENVKYIELFGEYLYESIIQNIRNVFNNAKIVNHYGVREVGTIAIGVDSDNLFIIDDNILVEIIDDYGRVINECGKAGRIIVSSLYKEPMSFIRYDTGDTGMWRDLYNSFSLIHGRTSVKFRIGSRLITSAFFDTLFARIERDYPNSIDEFSVVQKKIDNININIKTGRKYVDSVLEYIVNSINEVGIIQIKIKLVKELAYNKSGKYIRYISIFES